ncbi:Methyltransferase domain-containing protein [Sphingomonas laterariae]|uniref:Methyltransferase domain-containing protein n=1 Tax=Edaphosphingomonas laterariae TaxID=861865 RepID=A0A239BNK4_9SPHN|nr:class I SAM-dependent methyltransferase [Sphingomonas laterariae]SNS09202.1 Methyltransferase domain-containing protein [Sphingomonas laterariae]
MQIHESSKGYHGAARDYVAGRPDYPAEAVDWLRDVIGARPDRTVLEVGAGTGKFIPTLQACGSTIVALEPIDEMRAQIVRDHPEIATLAGTADAIPLGDGAVDAIVCAQAFHWFATPAALAEMRRVLSPGGMLGLIWNGRDERVPWVAALSTITNRYEGDTPRYRTGAWRQAFPAPGFTVVGERHVGHIHAGTAEQVVLQRTLSVSFIAALPAEDRQQVEREVRALIARTPELAGGRDVAFPYETSMFAWRAV